MVHIINKIQISLLLNNINNMEVGEGVDQNLLEEEVEVEKLV
jgi:hypothetical protein